MTTPVKAFTLLPPLCEGYSAWPALIGADGDYIVARGHIDPAVFACLAVAFYATEVGEAEALDVLKSFDDNTGSDLIINLTAAISHRWAVELAGPSDPEDEAYGIVPPGDPYLRWGEVTAETPDAFPVTSLDLT